MTLGRNGYPTGLVIQAEGDGNTQYEGGPAMANRLRDDLVTVTDDGTHGLYRRNECVTKKVEDYLIRGILPGSRSVCAGEPRPDIPADNTGSPKPHPAKESLESQAHALIAKHTPIWR